MSLRRHGEIYPCDEGTALRLRPCSSPWMSLQLAIPGGLLSSRARVRFTSRPHSATWGHRRTIPIQRTVNCGSTGCLSPGVHCKAGRCGSFPSEWYSLGMPYGLKRYQPSQQSHLVTFSCYRRRPRMRDEWVRDLFIECLERARRSYRFRVYGYVVMPEPVHLPVSEPEVEMLARAIQALKIEDIRRTPGPELSGGR